MASNNNNTKAVPEAKAALNQMKLEIASELGMSNYQQVDKGNLTARENGYVGGYMEKYLDITPGSVSVLGLMNDIEGKVRLLIDEDVLTERYFGCHPCINTSSLKFTTEDLIGKVIPALKHAPKMVKLGMTES